MPIYRDRLSSTTLEADVYSRGKKHVILLCHSVGGLVAYTYLDQNRRSAIRQGAVTMIYT